jgi:membrane protease YdiL (CAAX protease family)
MNKNNSVLWFVLLTMALSFACYFVPLPPDTRALLVPVLLVVVPALVCVLLVSIVEGRAGFRQLFARAKSGYIWLLIGALVGAGMRMMVLLIGVLAGTSIKADLSVAGTWFIVLATIPFAWFEELGWRRFALDRMLQSRSPFASALWIGLPWSAIHLILLLPGMMSEGTPMLPQTISLLCLSIILTWAYVRSGKSLMTVALLHGVQNGLTVLNRGVTIAEVTWLMMAAYLILAGLLIALDRKMFFSRP